MLDLLRTEADILRRAMGKKKKAELDKQKENFINGAIKNGISKDVANFVLQKLNLLRSMDLTKVTLPMKRMH